MRAATASRRAAASSSERGKPEGAQKAVALGVEVRVVGPKVRAELADREALRQVAPEGQYGDECDGLDEVGADQRGLALGIGIQDMPLLGPGFPAEEVRAAGAASGYRVQRPARGKYKILDRIPAIYVEVTWPGQRGSQRRVLLKALEIRTRAGAAHARTSEEVVVALPAGGDLRARGEWG
ncbi:hypothetical protein V1460_06595 [Streptomyces sp. SCSIO 30461]|uniref:hypothetical protein n=1 Tax=Streptomyces sp. SCSIO 30461 TaxID=3118085 RepID=UPI0030D10D6D